MPTTSHKIEEIARQQTWGQLLDEASKKGVVIYELVGARLKTWAQERFATLYVESLANIKESDLLPQASVYSDSLSATDSAGPSGSSHGWPRTRDDWYT